MNTAIAMIPVAALTLMMATPVFAAPAKNRIVVHAEPYRPIHRGFSDPSFGNRAGINYARSTGRCVTDLGYGRYEYCGW